MEPGYRPIEGNYLHFNFRFYRDHRIEVLPSFHLPGTSPRPPSTPKSGLALELRAEDGRVLGFHRCHLSDLHSDHDAPFSSFHEILPWIPETTRIAFVLDGAEVGAVDVEDDAPEMTGAPTATIDHEHNIVSCQWRGDNEGRPTPTSYLVRYSNDGGASWRGLAAGLTELGIVFDLSSLPGGEQCIFQVAASAGIRTNIAETEPITVDLKPRRPIIVSPQRGASFKEGELVILAGVGFSPDYGTAAFEDIVWSSNVTGFIGYGYQVATHTLPQGAHTLTLGVADGLGGEATAQVRIIIEPGD